MKIVQLNEIDQKKIKKYAKQSENTTEVMKQELVYLLDTNIMHLIIQNNLVLDEMRNDADGQSIIFILLESVMMELYRMEKRKQLYDNVTFSSQKAKVIRSKLQKYGTVYEKQTPRLSNIWKKAIDLFKTKKYRDKNNKPLSEVDCLLIVYFQHNNNVIVTTNDGLLNQTIMDLGGNTRTFFHIQQKN